MRDMSVTSLFCYICIMGIYIIWTSLPTFLLQTVTTSEDKHVMERYNSNRDFSILFDLHNGGLFVFRER